MADRVIDSFTGDYAWLGNDEPVDVVFENALYPSVTHALAAAQTLDRELRKSIAGMSTPGAARRAAASLKVRPDWLMIEPTITEDLLRAKFQHVRLRRPLMATVGIPIEGELGEIIMKIRDEWMEGEGQ